MTSGSRGVRLRQVVNRRYTLIGIVLAPMPVFARTDPHLRSHCLKMKPTDVNIAFIVGAGAVQNAWAPVLRAIQPNVDFPLTPDGANCFLARVVYMMRFCASAPEDMAKSELAAHKESLIQLRTAICRELRLAQEQGELVVRPEFETIVNAMILRYSHSLMVVTTNWDTVVPDTLRNNMDRAASSILIPLHIHGESSRQDRLYLPTEVTREQYRSVEEDDWIGALHLMTWRALLKAQRVVLYGLSLSPLDAELSQTLAAGWSGPNLQKISIVNPDHALVAHRVNLLLDHSREVIVKGYTPEDLTAGVDYTIRTTKRKEY